jgi:hypothetical protein
MLSRRASSKALEEARKPLRNRLGRGASSTRRRAKGSRAVRLKAPSLEEMVLEAKAAGG